MTNKVGRPDNQSKAREKLIIAARQLFVAMPYNKVATRLIAHQAGVNAALIHYYFSGKAGLFETMLRVTMAPVKERLTAVMARGSIASISDLMRTYYRILAPNPDLPKLIVRILMESDKQQRQIVEKVTGDFVALAKKILFTALAASGQLRRGIDPEKARITFFSLTLFPFLVPYPLLKMQDIELSEEYLVELAEHNLRVLTTGMLGNG
jgi:AcrR family transcriptional regulator